MNFGLSCSYKALALYNRGPNILLLIIILLILVVLLLLKIFYSLLYSCIAWWDAGLNENKAKSSFPALVELWLTHVSTYRLTNPVIDALLLKHKMCQEEEEFLGGCT